MEFDTAIFLKILFSGTPRRPSPRYRRTVPRRSRSPRPTAALRSQAAVKLATGWWSPRPFGDPGPHDPGDPLGVDQTGRRYTVPALPQVWRFGLVGNYPRGVEMPALRQGGLERSRSLAEKAARLRERSLRQPGHRAAGRRTKPGPVDVLDLRRHRPCRRHPRGLSTGAKMGSGLQFGARIFCSGPLT